MSLMRGNAWKHGKTGSKPHKAWAKMRQRCVNKNDRKYKDYGARGIAVCKRWMESFENFYADMGAPPSKKHTLGRIDNDGNYCPENCRWETGFQQANNTRKNKVLIINGEKMTVAEAARKFKIKLDALYGRKRRGWTDIEAVGLEERKNA